MKVAALFFICVATIYGQTALAQSATDDNQIRQHIIQQSVNAYLATGHPCACPYNLARNGSNCGGRSAYSRPGGASPLCYPSDVTDGMVTDWKRQHASGTPP